MNLTHKKKIEAAFDKGAHNYDWAALIQREVAQKLMCLLPENPPNSTTYKILEIGCGTGSLTKMLIKKYPNAQITALDISAKMIEKCHAKFPFIRFKKIDGENFNSTEKYDLIVSNMTIQWFEKPNEAIQDYRKNLKKNGAIYFSTLGQNNFKEWKSVLENLNFSSDKNRIVTYQDIIKEENIHTMYRTPFDFIRSLKAMGANYSAHKKLSPAQLKQACANLEKDHCCSITWHILYGEII